MYLFVVAGISSANAQQFSKDEQEIRGILPVLENGWNTKNADGFASAFAEKHDYVVVNGLYFPGWSRKDNAAAHQNLFSYVYPTSQIRLVADKVSFLRPDLALLHAIGASYEKKDGIPENPGVIMTILAEKKTEGWRIISFHNHSLQTFAPDFRLPMPATVMYASWYKK